MYDGDVINPHNIAAIKLPSWGKKKGALADMRKMPEQRPWREQNIGVLFSASKKWLSAECRELNLMEIIETIYNT